MQHPRDPEMRNRPAANGTAIRRATLSPADITETPTQLQERRIARLYAVSVATMTESFPRRAGRKTGELPLDKVEANALVVAPEAARALCRAAIEQYLDLHRISEYRAALLSAQAGVAIEVRRLLTEAA